MLNSRRATTTDQDRPPLPHTSPQTPGYPRQRSCHRSWDLTVDERTAVEYPSVDSIIKHRSESPALPSGNLT